MCARKKAYFCNVKLSSNPYCNPNRLNTLNQAFRMRRHFNIIRVAGVVVPLLAGLTACSQSVYVPSDEPIREVPFTDVRLSDSFWAPRIETNRTVSIPSAFRQCEINGRFDNFAIAGKLMQGEHRGDFPFDDTDPYKIIEGASYSLAAHYDEHLDHYLDSVIALIAAAQEDDGYLTTCVTNRCKRLEGWWGTRRWEKINSHELYNSGHLYEAAVAHYKSTGKRTLLDVAIRNADLVCQTFGPEEGQIHRPSGHPIIEMALCKLYQVTGNARYLETARYFVEETGRCTDGHEPSSYSQDHKPILEQDEILGHAVRAGYLYSGVADVAALMHDSAYQRAITRIWENMVSKKLYITGGIGSTSRWEGFGDNYDLPNRSAYCETCAAISNVYWNYRMFLATGDAKYADVYELALYNGVISGVSLSGDRFFYDNPLESDGRHYRREWFGCACCPGNVTRFMASVPLYQYALQANDIYVNLYIRGRADIKTPQGLVTVRQETDYPWSGTVRLVVTPEKSSQPFALRLRIPGWLSDHPVPGDLYSYIGQAEPYSVSVNGKPATITEGDGYATIFRNWKPGDEVLLQLPMETRLVQAHEQVAADSGRVAVQRGPVVYCLEAADQADGVVFNKMLPLESSFEAAYEPDKLGGGVVLKTQGRERMPDSSVQNTGLQLVPYCVWENRGPNQMEVWIPFENVPVPTDND